MRFNPEIQSIDSVLKGRVESDYVNEISVMNSEDSVSNNYKLKKCLFFNLLPESIVI